MTGVLTAITSTAGVDFGLVPIRLTRLCSETAPDSTDRMRSMVPADSVAVTPISGMTPAMVVA
jgi:hypothetical protein